MKPENHNITNGINTVDVGNATVIKLLHISNGQTVVTEKYSGTIGEIEKGKI